MICSVILPCSPDTARNCEIHCSGSDGQRSPAHEAPEALENVDVHAEPAEVNGQADARVQKL